VSWSAIMASWKLPDRFDAAVNGKLVGRIAENGDGLTVHQRVTDASWGILERRRGTFVWHTIRLGW
jgi:hypothetical protein